MNCNGLACQLNNILTKKIVFTSITLTKRFNAARYILFCISLLTFPSLSNAEIFYWVDENGKAHFSDKQKPEAARYSPRPLALSGEDRKQLIKNAKFFDSRAKEYVAHERQQAKKRKSAAKKVSRARVKCLKLQEKLKNLEIELKAKKRAGIRPVDEGKLKTKIDIAEAQIKSRC